MCAVCSNLVRAITEEERVETTGSNIWTRSLLVRSEVGTEVRRLMSGLRSGLRSGAEVA